MKALEVLSNLICRPACNAFFSTGLTVLRVHTKCLEDLMKRFARFKQNPDGYLSESDFSAHLRWPVQQDVQQFFQLCDTVSFPGKTQTRTRQIMHGLDVL